MSGKPAAREDHGSAIALGLLLCFAFAIRLHYFQQAGEQPLWWDEAEYLLKARALVFGTPDTGFSDARPLGFPLTLAAFYEIGLGEPSVRVALLVASLATVYLTYSIGERLLGTVVAFVGTGLFAMFYVPTFYTTRILTETPRLLLGLLAVRLYLSDRSLVRWAAIPVLAFATLTHLTGAIFILIVGAHFAAVHGYEQLRKNTVLAAVAAVVMLALLVWNYDVLLSTYMQWRKMFPRDLVLANLLRRMNRSFDWLYLNLGPLFGVLLIAGTVLLSEWVRRPGKLFRGESRVLANKFLLVLWLIGTLVFFGVVVVGFQDRYLIPALPAIFWTIGLATAALAARARRVHDMAGWAIVAAILVAGAVRFLPEGDRVFHARVTSQWELRAAGLWLKERTSAGDTLMSLSVPQMTYYTERATYPIPNDRESYESALGRLQPRFVILTRYERHPKWLKGVSAESVGLRPVTAFPSQAPTVLVMEPVTSR